MKKNDKISIFPALLEMFILMIILMGAFEAARQTVLDKATAVQWQVVTVGYSSLMAVIITFFLLRIYGKHNWQLSLEIKRLKRMEEDLKEKIAELSHFKELVVWWEKRMDSLQKELEAIKLELDKYKPQDDPPLL